MLQISARFDLNKDVVSSIYRKEELVGRVTEYSGTVDTRILNIEKDGGVLYSWNGATGTTRVGKYDTHTKQNKLLYTFDKLVHISSCSLNKEETLLAVSLAQRNREYELLKPVSKCLTLLIEIHPINNTKVLKAVDCRVMVQFLYPENERNHSVLESHLLLLAEDGYVDQYHVMLLRQEGYRVVMSNPDRLAKDRIAEDFSWVQWDCQTQRLYYLIHKDKAMLRCVQFFAHLNPETVFELALEQTTSSFPSMRFVNLGFDRYQEENPSPQVTMEVFTNRTGSMCVCYSQPISGNQELTYTVVLVHRGCSKTFTVSLEDKLILNTIDIHPMFIPLGYYIVVYLPGHFLHCINTRQQEMLCHSLFLSGPEAEIGLPEQCSLVVVSQQETTSLLDLDSGKIYTADFCPEFLLELLKADTPTLHAATPQFHTCSSNLTDTTTLYTYRSSTSICGSDQRKSQASREPSTPFSSTPPSLTGSGPHSRDPQKLAALHCLLVYMGGRPDLETKIIKWMCDNVMPMESFDQIQEFILASLYRVSYEKSLSLDKVLPYSTVVEKKDLPACLASVPGVSCSAELHAEPVFRGKAKCLQGYWEELQWNSEKMRYFEAVPSPRYSTSHIEADLSKLRHTMKLETKKSSNYLRQFEENAKKVLSMVDTWSLDKKLVPLFHEEDPHQRAHIGLMVDKLREHLSRHLPRLGKKNIDSLVVSYAARLLELIRRMLETVWLKYELGPRVMCFNQKGSPAEWAVFHVMFRILEATKGLCLPLPPGYHTLLAVLSVRCLPRHSFLQYVDHGLLELTETFVSRLMTDLDNSDANEELKFSILKRLPEAMERRICPLWDHPISSAVISRAYVRGLLERHSLNKGPLFPTRDKSGFRPEFLPLTYLAKILLDVEEQAMNPFEEQENVDARFVEETALKQTLILLGYEVK
ncbi:gamma-secretase-activating protein [Aplochiton taeniatus]